MVSAALLACSRPAVHQQESFVFGTQVQVTIAGVDAPTARRAGATVLAEFDRLHHLLHAWKPSALTELNTALAAGRTHRPPAEVLTLLREAQNIATQSTYLFDPGVGALIRLWGFQGDEFAPRLPAPEALAAWRKSPASIADLKISGESVSSKQRGLALDLGGYAKGVALDRAAQLLKAQGIHNALINIGGNVLALGSKNGTPWKVGVRDPAGNGYLATLDLRDGEAIGTSGDYQRFFDLDGRRYSHLIDPRSAEPAQGTRALTLLVHGAQAGMRSDALSKPLFLAGATEWIAMAQRLGTDQVLRIDASGQIVVSAGLDSRLHFRSDVLAPRIVDLTNPD